MGDATKVWHYHTPHYESDQKNLPLRVSPWAGHRNFAYDLVSALQPHRIVELGSHYGCSLFAFAQAIKDHKLSSELFGVDTWTGDEQAGFYSEEVYQLVTDTISTYFPEQHISTLRKTFLDARADIGDGTVDILHIDGLHTYEAVREDFETWRSKLAKNAIVLFHDVFPDLPYGSAIYWKEISSQYPHLAFNHSWGLGILFPNGDEYYTLVRGLEWNARRLAYEKGAQASLFEVQVTDLSDMVASRDATIRALEEHQREAQDYVNKLESQMIERWKIIEGYDSRLTEVQETLRKLSADR